MSAEAPCTASRARARPGRSTITTTTARSRGPRGARRGPIARKWVESVVTDILKGFLDDSENLALIAVDAAKYYEGTTRALDYLAGLEQCRDVEKGLANFVRAIEAGIFNEATQRRMAELQARKEALDDAIAAETVRQSLFEDEHSIRSYYDRFLHADFDNTEVRDSAMEYFVDKIYLHEDRLVVASWYSEGNREVPMEVLDGETEDPFAEGEAVRFDCFSSGSTKRPLGNCQAVFCMRQAGDAPLLLSVFAKKRGSQHCRLPLKVGEDLVHVECFLSCCLVSGRSTICARNHAACPTIQRED